MAITAKFNRQTFEKVVRERMKKIVDAIVYSLNAVGENFVKNARENADFQDRTGNLRSSIGYIITRDGVIVEENFEKSGKGTEDGSVGIARARKVSSEIAEKFPKGYALIVVAGMEYAAAVESNGYDVLTASSLIAQEELKRSIKLIKDEIPKMK